MSFLRSLIATIASLLLRTTVPTTSRLAVMLEVLDEKGQRVFKDQVAQLKQELYPRPLRLAGWLLLLSLTGLALYQDPLMGLCTPLLGRVATVGLNQLLTATLGGSTTWFVGLMGAVSSTGVSTASSTAFTDVNGTFAAGDVGRNILVMGAGAGGIDLATTIAAVGGTTSITLGAAASVSLTGARYALECRAADTMSSHASFVADTNWTGATRPAWTPGSVAAGSVDNSASPAAFPMNATTYIFGAFLVNDSTKAGTTGILYGAGVNSGGIVARVQTGYTINVTVTPSVTAA